MALACQAAPVSGPAILPGDFLERITKDEGLMRLTLPNGRQVQGKPDALRRSVNGVDALSGRLQHPEPGTFSFERGPDGRVKGSLGFDAAATEWKIMPLADGKGFQWLESPREDSFRPRSQELPKAGVAKPETPREDADAALRKDLKVEELAPGKLRIGEVILETASRSIRFPGVVNMHDGTVEYAVVTATGKRHEALFSTTATPRDIHLAMLLLGVKPSKCVETPEKSLKVPDGSSVDLRVEWTSNGNGQNRPIRELITVARTSSQMKAAAKSQPSRWLYNGSRFNEAGFAASLEGSIVSLIADDLALINNAASDRADDEIHLPDPAVMPKTDTPVTLIFSLPPVSPKPKPNP